MPLLTKAGCNQGACHGKGAGQNGFRLSLRGYAPDQDYRWITREFDGRRIDPTNPEESLLLRKATGQTPHEGGRLFAPGSREYELLLDWIKAGFPGPDKDDAKVEAKLELDARPHSVAASRANEVQLVATADVHRRHEARRDLAHQVRLQRRRRISRSSPAGKVERAAATGRPRCAPCSRRKSRSRSFSMPFDRAGRSRSGSRPKNNFVDEHVFAKLQDLRIEPSDLCTDDEFIRRAFLDAIGVLPTPDEVTGVPRRHRRRRSARS